MRRVVKAKRVIEIKHLASFICGACGIENVDRETASDFNGILMQTDAGNLPIVEEKYQASCATCERKNEIIVA